MQAIRQLWTGFILHLGLLVVATVYAVPIERHLNNFYDSEAVELCVDKDDGVYSLGCIAEFVDCSQGQSFVMRCADGSVMDGDQGECVPRDASSICLKGGRSLSVEFIMKNIANTDVDVYRSQPVRSDFCSKRINGNYNIGCTSAFLTCVVGEPIAMECPKGMVFDDALSRCERSEYVTVCENSDRVPSKEDPRPSNDVFRVQRRVAMRSVSDSLIVPTTLPAATNIEATPSDHELCRGRPSGLYAKGCSGQALWCTDGVATVLSCPFGFLYEHNSRRCVPRESMAECPPELLPVIFAPSSTAWWAAPSSEPGLVAERRRIVPVNERSSADPKEVPSPDNINVACASLPDGVQSEGCSKFLITCVGQKAVVKECPSTLVYDITSGLCLSKDSVSSCAESPVVGSLQKVTTSDKVDNYISEKSEIFCEDHEDGIYGEDCSSRFFVCLSHETLHFNCPHSYVFDSSASHCSNVTSVPTCAETDPPDATSMRGSSLADTSQLTKGVSFEFLEDAEPDEDLREAVSTLGAMAQEVTVLKTSDESFGSACIGMPDGAISLGCSTDFIICAAEEARLHRCPFELKYDSQSQMCIHQIEVTACVEGAADLSLVSGLQRAYASTNMRQRSIGAATSGSRTRAVLSDRVKGSLTNQRPTLSSLPSMGTRMGGVGDTSDSRHTVQDANILLPKSVKYRTAKEEIAALANGGAQPDTRNTVVEGASGKIPIMASTSAFKTQVESFAGGEMNALVSSGSSANGYSYVPMTFTTEATVLSPSSYQAPTFPTVLEHLTEHAVPSSSKLEEQSTAALSMASSELSIPAGVGEVENSKVSVETVTENIITAEMPAVEGQSEMGTPTMLSKKNITAELAAEEKISGKAAERATLRSSEEKDAFSAPSDGSEAMVYDDGVVDEVAKESVEDAPVTEVSIDVITADEGEILAAALGEVALSSGDEKFSTGSTTIASAASLVESLSSSASPPSDTNRLILAATAGEAATLSLRRGSLENTGGATSKDQGTASWSMGWSLAPEVISSGQGKMVPVADNSALPAAGPSTEYVVSRPGDRAVPADEYAETTLVQISAFPSLAPLLPGENNAVPSSLKEEGGLIVSAAKMAVENGTVTTAVENSTKLLSKEDCCISSAVETVASDGPNVTMTSRYEMNRQAGMDRILYSANVEGSTGPLSGKMATLPGTVVGAESLLGAEADTGVTTKSPEKLEEAGSPAISPLDAALLKDAASAIEALVDGSIDSQLLDELVDLEAMYEHKRVKPGSAVQEDESTQPSDISSGDVSAEEPWTHKRGRNFEPARVVIEAIGKSEVDSSSMKTSAEERGPQEGHSTNAWQRKTNAFSAKTLSADERGIEAERSTGTEFGTETASANALMSTGSTETSHSENVDEEGRYSIAALYDGDHVLIAKDSTKGPYLREYSSEAENLTDSKPEVRNASYVTASAMSGFAQHQPTASTKAAVVTIPTNIHREFSCMGVPDGPKAIGCSSDYVVCLFGTTNWLKCENDLKFDEDTLQCVTAANIAACTKQRHDGTISTAPIAEATFVGEVAKHESEVSGILSSASREISSTKRVTTAIDADEFLKSTAPLPPIARHKDSACSDLPDGIYGVGCSPLILFCILGENRYVECPRDQVFDPVSQKCLLPWFVRACRQSPYIAVKNWPTSVFVESTSIIKPVEEGALESSRVRTTAEVTTEPSILAHKMSAKSFETDRVAIVPVATTVANELAQNPLNGLALGSSSSSTLKPLTSSTVKSLTKFSCKGREGTFFVVGCSSVYVSCMVEPYGLRFCRDSFAFDQQTNECREKNAVSACQKTTLDVKGNEEEATTAATFKTIEEKEIDKWARMTPRRKTTTVRPLRDSRSSCRGRKDGYYDIGCSSRYFSCLGEKTTMLQCDLGLKFDVITGECLAKRYVMACGGRPKMPPKYDASYLEKSATVPSGEAIRKYAAKISKRSSTVINDASNIGY